MSQAIVDGVAKTWCSFCGRGKEEEHTVVGIGAHHVCNTCLELLEAKMKDAKILKEKMLTTKETKEDIQLMIESGVWDCLEMTDDCSTCKYNYICPFEEVDKDGRGSGV